MLPAVFSLASKRGSPRGILGPLLVSARTQVLLSSQLSVPSKRCPTLHLKPRAVPRVPDLHIHYLLPVSPWVSQTSNPDRSFPPYPTLPSLPHLSNGNCPSSRSSQNLWSYPWLLSLSQTSITTSCWSALPSKYRKNLAASPHPHLPTLVQITIGVVSPTPRAS